MPHRFLPVTMYRVEMYNSECLRYDQKGEGVGGRAYRGYLEINKNYIKLLKYLNLLKYPNDVINFRLLCTSYNLFL